MTALDYADILARIIKASSRMELILRREYEASVTSFVGTAQDRQDWQQAAPYAGCTALESLEDTDRVESTVEVEIGLYDERVVQEGGIAKLAAYGVFKELVPALVRDFKEQVLGVAPTAFVQDWRVAYSQGEFPLVTATVTLTIIEPTPVGHWRR